MNRIVKTLAISCLAIALAGMAMADTAPLKMGTVKKKSSGTVATFVANSPDHKTLASAFNVTGVSRTVKGNYTLLAPVDTAFSTMPYDTPGELLSNRPYLTKLLRCNVIPGRMTAASLKRIYTQMGGTYSIATLGGCWVWVSVQNDTVMLRDERGTVSRIVGTDIRRSNGTVQVIDKVLQPAN